MALVDAGQRLQMQAKRVYTPGEPITDPSLFAGRRRLLDAATLRRTSGTRAFVIYGASGVGKTSFAHVLLADLRPRIVIASTVGDFVTMFLTVLVQLGEHFTQAEVTTLTRGGYTIGSKDVASASLESSEGLKQAPVAPQSVDVNFVVNRLVGRQTDIGGIIIDEFDRVADSGIRSQILEVIKGLADAKSTIVIAVVGTKASDRELFNGASSYEEWVGRLIFPIGLTEMTPDEEEQILFLRQRWIDYQPEVGAAVAWISAGSPARVHQLALWATFSWIARSTASLVAPLVARILRALRITSWEPQLEDVKPMITVVDLNLAVTQFVSGYGAEHERVKALIDSISDQSQASPALTTLALSDKQSMTLNELASVIGQSIHELKTSLDVLDPEVVRLINEGEVVCYLSRPHVRSFLRARSYLETHHVPPLSGH